MLIYGAGGHAKVIISIICANGCQINAIFDDTPFKSEFLGVTQTYNAEIFSEEELIIAIGNNTIRKKISEQIHHVIGKAVHPSALIDQSVQIGEGTCIMHTSVVQAAGSIGKHVIVNTGVIMDHGCHLEDFVHLAPGVVLAGDVHVGESTLVGTGSIITPGLRIGSNCVIAAGSVVTRNIPNGSVVRGNPARIIRQ